MPEKISRETERLVSRLRFRHLRLITELERGGSLRAAAQSLNLTQPALSKALAEIESAFGFALFTRNARGLTPTAQGRVALRGAVLLLEELAHLRVEAAAGENAVATVRIGAPPFVAQGYLPEVLKKLLQGDPPVRVQLLEERVPVLMQALVQGEVDALLTSYPMHMPNESGVQLSYEKLFEVDLSIIAPHDHPLTRARKVTWQRLAQEPWVMPARSSMARRMIEDCFTRDGVIPPQPVIESTSPVTNVQLVAAGIGLSVAPETTVLRNAQNLSLVKRVRVSPPIPSGPVALIYRMAVANPRVAFFRAALGLSRAT
ncbi:MAG: LysR family transcriptional regulator [Polaromonas sp.]|uniref:LysR family transcriptional regulator n=1 Tax=Polaromonas sp. TaxID=1869339 RepID=UPI0025D64CCB|nr:LysR family transcriptional regulator [Polaromonas sp.]MBI2728715.1 LysR family transcriptional regulator [Polaromonas sp.]